MKISFHNLFELVLYQINAFRNSTSKTRTKPSKVQTFLHEERRTSISRTIKKVNPQNLKNSSEFSRAFNWKTWAEILRFCLILSLFPTQIHACLVFLSLYHSLFCIIQVLLMCIYKHAMRMRKDYIVFT